MQARVADLLPRQLREGVRLLLVQLCVKLRLRIVKKKQIMKALAVLTVLAKNPSLRLNNEAHNKVSH